MQKILDFQDVLKYLLLKHKCYSTKKTQKIKNTEIHVNSQLLCQVRINPKASLENQLLQQLKNLKKNTNQIYFYFPANSQASKKEDFEAIYKCLEAKLKLKILNDFKNRMFDQNEPQSCIVRKLLQSNSFFLQNHLFIQQKEYMTLIAKEQFNQHRVPQFVSSQLLYLHYQNKNCITFDSPLNFCFSQTLKKIAYQIHDGNIYFYDISKFVDAFKLQKHDSRNILFWVLVIYMYKKEKQNKPLIYRATQNSSKDQFQQYIRVLNKDILKVESIINSLKNFLDLQITYENWKIMKNKFNLKRNNDFNDFNSLIEHLVYDRNIQTAVYFNLNSLLVTKYWSSENKKRNLFLNKNIWKLLYSNLIPLDFTHFLKFQKNQMFFLTNYYSNASQEQQYFQCNLNHSYSQQNFELINNLLISITPKLVVLKQYFVNKQLIISKDEQSSNLFIFSSQTEPSLFGAIKAIKFNQFQLVQDKNNSVLNTYKQIQLNIFIKFLGLLRIFDQQKLQYSKDLEVLYLFGKNNMIEEGIVILHFIKHDLFGSTSFLTQSNDYFLKPQIGQNRIIESKKVEQFSEDLFQQYFEDRIGYHNVDLFYPVYQLIKMQKEKDRQKYIYGLWKIYQKNIYQSKFFMQENFFKIMLKIFIEIKEQVKCSSYEIWKKLQDILQKNYKNIITLSFLAAIIQLEYRGSYLNDLRALRIDSFVRFLNNKFFNIVQSCLCDVLLNRLQVDPQLHLQNLFQNLPFAAYKFTSYGCIVKEIIYLNLVMPLIQKQFPQILHSLKQKLIRLVKQVQIAERNIFKKIQDIVSIFEEAAKIDEFKEKYVSFFENAKNLKDFIESVQLNFEKLDITL